MRQRVYEAVTYRRHRRGRYGLMEAVTGSGGLVCPRQCLEAGYLMMANSWARDLRLLDPLVVRCAHGLYHCTVRSVGKPEMLLSAQPSRHLMASTVPGYQIHDVRRVDLQVLTWQPGMR